MGIALAAWGWTGDQFAQSTPHEFYAAYEVWRQLLLPAAAANPNPLA